MNRGSYQIPQLNPSSQTQNPLQIQTDSVQQHLYILEQTKPNKLEFVMGALKIKAQHLIPRNEKSHSSLFLGDHAKRPNLNRVLEFWLCRPTFCVPGMYKPMLFQVSLGQILGVFQEGLGWGGHLEDSLFGSFYPPSFLYFNS